MFHSPTSETKQQSDSTRTQLPERTDFSARAPFGDAPVRSQLAQLHGTYGNQAVLRMLSNPTPSIQAKLTVNQPGDVFEQEADRVADQVMRMTVPPAIQRKCSSCEEEDKVQRKCAECEEEEKKTGLQRKESGAGPQFAPPSVHSVLNSSGRPLDSATRVFMEPRFGHDFSGVRVHTDASAADSARAVNALAYTSGQHVVFGAGQYSPSNAEGRRLLAHELTHVVQQSGGAVSTVTPGPAAKVNRLAYGGPPVIRGSTNSPLIQQQPTTEEQPASTAVADLPCAAVPPEFKSGLRVRFGQDQDTPLPGQDGLFAKMAAEANEARLYQLHGNASKEGAAPHNLDLSCRRAQNVRDRLASEGVKLRPALFAHGATTLYGDQEIDNRNVVLVTERGSTPRLEEPKGDVPPPKKEEPKVPENPTYSTVKCVDGDLLNIIRPADALARKMLDNVRRVIDQDPAPKGLNHEYHDYFYADVPSLPAIRNGYSKLVAAFSAGGYTWECTDDCEKGMHGKTTCNDSLKICYGNIGLCINNIKKHSQDPVVGTAKVMIHEMGHRRLFWCTDHSYCSSTPDDCDGCNDAALAEDMLTNPDSFACLAQVAWKKYR